jgi:hypothetical protein
MGVHSSWIFVRGDATTFRKAFTEIWPNYEVVATAESLPNWATTEQWAEKHAKFVASIDWTKENPGQEVYLFSQEDSWAVLEDSSYVLAADEKALAALSAKFGVAMSLIVEATSGSTAFFCFEGVMLRRRVSIGEDAIDPIGDPLPEEEGLDSVGYFLEWAERLTAAFGLTYLTRPSAERTHQAIAVIDHTDYSTQVEEVKREFEMARIEVEKPQAAAKRWWQFW